MIKLNIESDNLEDYLKEIPPIIQFDSPLIKAHLNAIRDQSKIPLKQAQKAFNIARDEISHSFDTKRQNVTISCEEVLKEKDGICFAKAHLLVTLLRGLKIPAGFCYQRVLKNPADKDSGFALHGLNAVYLDKYGWFRLDPRGNKPGVDAQFSPEKEKLAYPIRTELGEVDYPNVFTKPLNSVIEAMKSSKNTQELFNNRPEHI